MKTIISLAVFCFALSFCNLADRLTGGKTDVASTNTNTAKPTDSNTSSPTSGNEETVEKYSLTPDQSRLLNDGKEMKWDEQGMGWILPPTWKKMTSTPTTLQWSSPDGAFLIVNISPLADDFPTDVSLQAYHKSSADRQKNGELEKFRYVEIDGVKGIEFVESMPHDQSDPRRHQWLAYRKFAGRTQMINLMLSTKGSNFEKHRDEFSAIMASTKMAR